MDILSALVFIVLASWIFYQFVAPKKWRDWTRAGLVQAFLVCLYVEMFGFPLTLYILTRVFRVDAAWLGQIQPLWATLLGLSGPAANALMNVTMMVGWVFVLIGVGWLIQGWREVYQANKEGRLATDGLYGLMRHPQYSGIILAVFGEGVVHWPTVISLALFPVIVIAYYTLAKREEQEMVEKFGEQYREYQRRVPMFIPRFWRRQAPAEQITKERPPAKVR